MKYCFAVIIPLLILFSVFSCKPDDEILTREGKLQFSADTVRFDTVFVSTGSVTRRLKVYNPSDKAVEISEIKLAALGASDYDLIIDGEAKDIASNITVRGLDSLLILVKVFIDPNNADKPFIVEDDVVFQTNGNVQKVHLEAYGQNANFFRDEYVDCNEIWEGPKAYVLYGDVVVKENCTLTIRPGTRIYGHAGAKLYVLGTLKVEGTKDKKVFFQNDRRDSTFANSPGQWSGIFLYTKSNNNHIQHAEIKNAEFGLNIFNPNGNQTIVENTVIKNCLAAGIVGVLSNVKVTNTLISNCWQYAVVGLGGCTFDLNFCTIANYTPTIERKNESVAFSDTIDLGPQLGGLQPPGKTNLTIRNSIIWAGTRNGKLQDELLLLTGSNSPISISNSLLQANRYQQVLNTNGNLINQDPKFVKPDDGNVLVRKIDYSLKDESPAINAASGNTGVSIDLRGESRPQGLPNPDLGAYESKK